MPPTWIVLTALFALACAAALVWLVCEFRAAEVHEEMAEADDHPHPVPSQREPVDPTTLRVLHDSREDGPLPEKLSERMMSA